jgi:uncharacterized protein (TIGR02246 family)
MIPAALPLVLLLATACTAAAAPADPSGPPSGPPLADEARVGAVLDAWHAAAAAADEERYFSFFAPEAVFLGTDASERWDLAAFRAFAHPHFAKGKAWTFRAVERHVAFAASGEVAWFDERLDTASMGECRGSGVLVRRDGAWKIAHYNLTVPIPNAILDAVEKQIAEHQAGGG